MTKKQTRRNEAPQVKPTARRHQTSRGREGPEARCEEPDLLALQRAVANPDIARPADILALQRAYGNRAVRQRLQLRPPRGRGLDLADPTARSMRPGRWPRRGGGGVVQRVLLAEGAAKSLRGMPAGALYELAKKLLAGEERITNWVVGNCYDCVAFVKYLQGVFNHDQLLKSDGKSLLLSLGKQKWPGGMIKEGQVVLFQRSNRYVANQWVEPAEWFHAAIGLGHAGLVRGAGPALVQLGAGWAPADLNALERTTIDVHTRSLPSGMLVRVFLAG